MTFKKMPGVKSVETKHMEERAEFFRALKSLDRRSFLKVSAAAFGAVASKGLLPPHSFQPVNVALAATPGMGRVEPFTFAYISDSHLYDRTVNDRFVNAIMRAVDDVNAMSPQPDFVFYGGDLAQLGQPSEIALGAQILKNLKAPLRMMVGEHDWYFDMGEKWRSLFGPPTYSFEHKGAHLVVLNSVVEKDFWTARNLSPMQRMRTVAGLDNAEQSAFSVGEEQRAWLERDLEGRQSILKRFKSVVVFHGHTHQMLTNRIGNIHFHGFLSTAWPWPYAPQGLPVLNIQMGRANPFDPQDGCGDGSVSIYGDGLADSIYNLWNRNPVTISRSYMASHGAKDRPALPNLPSF
jgi:Icc protein